MADITNFDPDDISNIQVALKYFRDALKAEHKTIPGTANSRRYYEFAELESRMSRMVTLTGEAF